MIFDGVAGHSAGQAFSRDATSFRYADTEVSGMGHQTRIMYIERKAGELTGPARIGRVTLSKTGATLYYKGQQFRSLKGAGFKANYYDIETGDEYWISGPRRDGADALYATNVQTEVDENVRAEYWTKIRKKT